jgi:DNA-binding MarR family transcriptional regulator
LEEILFDLVDKVKPIISQEVWDNILLNCTKNELFVLMHLFRNSDVNMTQISEYLHAPLNTTTGIVGRMERKDMVRRIRSESDKRVVTIVLTESGRKQISAIIGMFLEYGQRVVSTLTSEELTLLSNVVTKIVDLLQNKEVNKPEMIKKIRKIEIE